MNHLKLWVYLSKYVYNLDLFMFIYRSRYRYNIWIKINNKMFQLYTYINNFNF